MDEYNDLDCLHDWVISSCYLSSDFILSVYSEIEENVNHELKIVFENVSFIEYQIWDNKESKINDINEINYRMKDSWFLHAFNCKNEIVQITNIGGSDDFKEAGGQLSIKFKNFKILDELDNKITCADIIQLNKKRFE